MTWQHILGGILLMPVALILVGTTIWMFITDWRGTLLAFGLIAAFLTATVGGAYLISGGF
jgi:hypothetical protein